MSVPCAEKLIHLVLYAVRSAAPQFSLDGKLAVTVDSLLRLLVQIVERLHFSVITVSSVIGS